MPKCSKVAKTAQIHDLVEREEVTHPLMIPEKFLLFAIWHINSLMVFLKVLLSQGALAFYTL